MAALIVAVTLGLVALAGLLGARTSASTWTLVVVNGLPLVGLAGAAVAGGGIDLKWAAAMVVAVFLAVVAASVGPPGADPDGPRWGGYAFWMLAGAVVSVLLAGAVVRWLAVVAASMANLSPRALGLVILVAATTAAAGGGARRTLALLATILAMIGALVLLLVGFVAGVPATLTAPLLPVHQSGGAALWLVAIVVLGGLHPGLRAVRAAGGSLLPGAAVLAVVTACGLFGLLSFSGGYIAFPSFGLSVIAGYVSFAPPAVGAVFAVILVIVAAIAAAVSLQAMGPALSPVKGTPLVPGRFLAGRWLVLAVGGVGAALVALSAAPVEVWAVLGLVIAVAGAFASLWAGRRRAAPDEIDLAGAGGRKFE